MEGIPPELLELLMAQEQGGGMPPMGMPPPDMGMPPMGMDMFPPDMGMGMPSPDMGMPPMGMPPPGMLPGGMPPGLEMPGLSDMWDDEAPLKPPPEKKKEPKRKKPTKDEALEKIDAMKDFWKLRDERMDDDKRFYDMDIGERTVSGNLVLRNICTTMVEKTARILGSQEPIYSVIPPKNILKDEAQQVEDFIRHAWSTWNRHWYLSGYSTLYHDMAHFLALRGWMAIRLRYNPDADAEELPVSTRLVDPRSVYPHFGEEGIMYVAHVYTQTVAQVKESYPDAKGEWTERDDEEFVNCKAYYDDWWYAFFIEDEEILPVRAHEFGFVPWVIMISGGSPIRHTENDTQDWVKNVGPSIFHHIKEAVLALNRLMSQLADEVERQSNPPMLYFFDPQNRKEPIAINFEPGSTNHLFYDRERVEPLSLGPRPSEAQPLMNMLMEDIEKGGLPSSLWGMGDSASGFQQVLSQGAARDALYPIVRAMEYAQEEVNRQSLLMIRDFHDDDVGFFVRDANGDYVSGATINFELLELVGVYSNVRYKDVSPQDKMARANIAMALVREKLISLETARSDYLELDNPSRENERVISDLVYMNEELINNVLIEKVLEGSDPWLYSAWLEHKQEEAMKPPEGGPPGMPPGGAPPGMPPGMEGMLPPSPSPGMEQGLPPETLPPNMQGMDLLLQSMGGAAGGMGAQRPEGIPGGGALPVRMPLM
jgi:hypothetical protein